MILYDKRYWRQSGRFLQDFTFRNQEIAESQQRQIFVWVLISNPKIYFPTIKILRLYDVELVMASKNSRTKIIYQSAATNSKWYRNLIKMLYSCLCASFMSCYCILMKKWTKMAALWLSFIFPVFLLDQISPPSEARKCGPVDCCMPRCILHPQFHMHGIVHLRGDVAIKPNRLLLTV